MGTQATEKKGVEPESEVLVTPGQDKSMAGALTGFSVSSLMQMLQTDNRTTLVDVKGAGLQCGTIYFDKGEPLDASCGSLKGDQAILAMLEWDKVTIHFLALPKKPPALTVKNTSMGILMEGMRLLDERRMTQAEARGEQDNHNNQDNHNKQEGVNEMAGLKQMMKDIADEMDGVIAVGVVGMDGITIAAHNPTGADMDVVSAKFAMVMKLLERSVDDLKSLGNFEENLVQTANAWILTRFLDKQYYLACIVSREGTLGNVRLVAKKYLDQVQRAL